MIIEDQLKDKIYIEEETHEIYKKLKEELRLFDTMKDIFLVSAALGYFYKEKKPLGKKRDIFTKNNFDREIDIPFIGILVLADKLADKNYKDIFEGDFLGIVEEYANAGIWKLNDIIGKASDEIEAIEKMIMFLLEE